MIIDIKIIALILFGFFVIGILIGMDYEHRHLNNELIERGLKHYDTQTGQLIWKEDL